jgi:uncharacterized membrane protein YkoI
MNTRSKLKKNLQTILWTMLSIFVLMITVVSIKAFSESYNLSRSDAKNHAIAGSNNGTVDKTNPATAYIGDKAARDIVLAKLPGIDITEIHFEYDNGRAEYDGIGYLNNVKYHFDIDAMTGEILKWEIQQKQKPPTPIPNPSPNSGPGTKPVYIGVQAVKSIALAKVPGATIVEICLGYDHKRVHYDGEMYLGNTIYDFAIDAITGEILDWGSDIND